MKLKLPENIEDITLDQYQKYTVLVGREDLDEISFNKRLISIFTDLKFRDIENKKLDIQRENSNNQLKVAKENQTKAEINAKRNKKSDDKKTK